MAAGSDYTRPQPQYRKNITQLGRNVKSCSLPPVLPDVKNTAAETGSGICVSVRL